MLKDRNIGTLRTLLKICDSIGWTFQALANPYKYSPASFQSSYRPVQYREHQLIRRLRASGYVKLKRNGAVTVTKKGLTLAIISCMQSNARPLPPGHLCLVSFDVPERSRWIRRWLRTLFKSLEFRMLHRSVWIGTTDVAEHLQYLAEMNGLKRYITVYTAQQVDWAKNVRSDKK